MKKLVFVEVTRASRELPLSTWVSWYTLKALVHSCVVPVSLHCFFSCIEKIAVGCDDASMCGRGRVAVQGACPCPCAARLIKRKMAVGTA